MKTAASVLVAFLLLLAPAPAAEETRRLPDAFDPSAGRRPAVGDWVEYLVCYPTDPLENSLIPRAGSSDSREHQAAGDDFLPSFEPVAAWRALPLRFVFTAVDDDGYRAALTFAGLTREVSLPAARKETAEFVYEEPQPEDTMLGHRVGDRVFETTRSERRGEQYGFVRLFHPDLPFGIARFATADADLILIAVGTGEPPAFPAVPPSPPDPPPGELFIRE